MLPFKLIVMCIYEQKISNQKYEITKKNKGNVPECKDYRKLYINVGCGWCEECRKKIANDWKIRLTEEIKEEKNCIGITLSYSPENIEKLETEIYTKKYRGLEPDKNGEIMLDVNIMAAYSIRMWSERWRKKHKKAPKHWLVTELGHKNSERLHLHGIIWHNKNKKEIEKELNKTWKYGNVRVDEWVDQRTINYLCKYVTKIDEYHKGYKQRVFTSKKIGSVYCEKYKSWHKYRGEDTITYYKGWKGLKYGLPRYFKMKLWNETERDNLWTIQLNKHKIFLQGEEYDINNEDEKYIEKFINQLKGKRETNISAGYGDNTTGTKKYIITEAMKMNFKQLINYDKTKLIKCVNKREKIEEKNCDGKPEISKGFGVKKVFWGRNLGNLTEAERKYNELIEEALAKRISVKKVRLIHAGLIPDVGYRL